MIKLEKWFDTTTIEGLPLLLEALGRCPPEDVGGAPGYADYRDPTHSEHENIRLWGPERFDPDRRRPEDARSRRHPLSGIRKPRRRATRLK
ncbi:plasmid pRiA4b ORF-3 family protein [Bradyrhizobium sp. C-145]|uniref:IS1096 element passenger TnpR family protein n=1 Tax=Bradyrhizobium sp. C-145 TaxID=574727 RepID=UPI00201B4DF8|nr:plasmid pRiA4b ORF-3 family protein [Bradyrhizobium sp. C-145]UQR68102.1 plasmid pRiA4b ORF-3 family protein [Bradyrhizobium sp. C-145]